MSANPDKTGLGSAPYAALSNICAFSAPSTLYSLRRVNSRFRDAVARATKYDYVVPFILGRLHPRPFQTGIFNFSTLKVEFADTASDTAGLPKSPKMQMRGSKAVYNALNDAEVAAVVVWSCSSSFAQIVLALLDNAMALEGQQDDCSRSSSGGAAAVPLSFFVAADHDSLLHGLQYYTETFLMETVWALEKSGYKKLLQDELRAVTAECGPLQILKGSSSVLLSRLLAEVSELTMQAAQHNGTSSVGRFEAKNIHRGLAPKFDAAAAAAPVGGLPAGLLDHRTPEKEESNAEATLSLLCGKRFCIWADRLGDATGDKKDKDTKTTVLATELDVQRMLLSTHYGLNVAILRSTSTAYNEADGSCISCFNSNDAADICGRPPLVKILHEVCAAATGKNGSSESAYRARIAEIKHQYSLNTSAILLEHLAKGKESWPRLLVLPDTPLGGDFKWNGAARRILRFRDPNHKVAEAWGQDPVGQLRKIFKDDDLLLVGESPEALAVKLKFSKVCSHFTEAQRAYDNFAAHRIEFLRDRNAIVNKKKPVVEGMSAHNPCADVEPSDVDILNELAWQGVQQHEKPSNSAVVPTCKNLFYVADDVSLGKIRPDNTTPRLYEPGPVVAAAPWGSTAARAEAERALPVRITTPWLLLGTVGSFSDMHIEPHETHVHVTLLFGGHLPVEKSTSKQRSLVGKLWFVEATPEMAEVVGMKFDEFLSAYATAGEERWVAIPQFVGDTFVVSPGLRHLVVNCSPTFAVARNFCGMK